MYIAILGSTLIKAVVSRRDGVGQTLMLGPGIYYILLWSCSRHIFCSTIWARDEYLGRPSSNFSNPLLEAMRVRQSFTRIGYSLLRILRRVDLAGRYQESKNHQLGLQTRSKTTSPQVTTESQMLRSFLYLLIESGVWVGQKAFVALKVVVHLEVHQVLLEDQMLCISISKKTLSPG